MKKQLMVIALASFLGLNLISCDGGDNIDVKYAKYTVEENKENMEEEGLKVIDQLDGMKELSAVSAINDLVSIIEQSIYMDEPTYYAVSRILSPVAGMHKSPIKLANLRSSIFDKETEINYLSDVFKDYTGVYTYNSKNGAFDYVSGGTGLTFEFPIGNSVSNNGKLILNNYTCQLSKNKDFETQELPKSMDLNLYDGKKKLLNMEMDASYNQDDMPSSQTYKLVFSEGYSFSEAFSNNEKDLKWEFAFKNNDNNLLSFAFNTNGSYSYDNVTSFAEGTFDGPDKIDEILNSANAFIQFGNLKLAGTVNFEEFTKEYDKYFADGIENLTKTQCDLASNMLNKNMVLVLMYADQKKAIAKSSFSTVEVQYYLDDYSGQKEKTYFTPQMSFVFEDGSQMDESFFGTGFNELRNVFKTFMNDMNDNYVATVPYELGKPAKK